MSDIKYRVFFIVCLLLLPVALSADNLPSLPASSNIRTGRLDNGIVYYLAANSKQKGLADITLVQKAGFANETLPTAGESIVAARGSLTGVPRFPNISPFHYLKGKGLFPGTDGYVSVYEDATIYRFDNLVTGQSKDVMDSTLLMVFDMVEQLSKKSDRYYPDNQAIIIAGDIDQNAILSKMNMLSLLVTKKKSVATQAAYSWADDNTVRFEARPSNGGEAVTITAEYRSPRTPTADMATIQPLVSRKMATEFGVLVRNRLASYLKEKKIPYSSIKYSYLGSSSSPDDEKFIIGIVTSPENVLQATTALSRTLADIDTHGVTPDEYKGIQNQFVTILNESSELMWETNSRLTSKCISSYLYGASLSSDVANYEFLTKRNIRPEVGAKLLSNFISAILGPSKNLTLTCDAQSSESLSNDVLRTYDASWTLGAKEPEKKSRDIAADSTSLKKVFSGVKLKTELQEPMTGGKLWVFSNGMTVIYKQVDMGAMFSYSFLLKSGFSQAISLQKGEYAYLADMLSRYKVSGMKGSDFANMLAANGVTMTPEITVSDFTLRGTAPKSKLQLLLKSILSVGYDRSEDVETYDYFRKCLNSSAGTEEYEYEKRMASLDSLLSPGNRYPSYRSSTVLADDFPKRADKFFTNAFSKANDGVVIILGNFVEADLKKLLTKYMGGFKTDNVSSFRSRAQYRTITGLSKHIKDGTAPYLDLVMSSLMNYTAENFMAYNVASLAMTKAIASAAATSGWHHTSKSNFVMFPEERFNLYVSMSPADIKGLPASMVLNHSVDDVASNVNDAIQDLGKNGITDQEVAAYKAIVGGTLAANLTSPTSLEHMLILRYSYGKDLMTKYQDKLNAVTAAKVNTILAQMANGGIAEYGSRVKDKPEVIKEALMDEPVMPQFDTIAAPHDSLGMCEVYRTLYKDVKIPDYYF